MEHREAFQALIELSAPLLPEGAVLSWDEAGLKRILQQHCAMGRIVPGETTFLPPTRLPLVVAKGLHDSMEELRLLRFTLVPSRISEDRFWELFWAQVCPLVVAHVLRVSELNRDEAPFEA